jgi:predicted nuclease of predicted toxin-antitoxin system
LKVLFDVNVPKGLRRFLINHHVRTAQQEGWIETKNGELLRVAEESGFEAMVTADKNIAYQQNLKNRKIAIVVLPTNDLEKLQPVVPRIVAMVEAASSGSYQEMDLAALGPRPDRAKPS